ncbi:hypothetical protein BDD12DRAFT_852256 [Trichophaea hybrida]|nr:hypothetical protein BDD12DRAFT_852256 [Trichophaea hybrida]
MAGKTEADQTSYLDRVTNLAVHNREYHWLLQYLKRDHDFISQRLKPVLQGNTRVVIADFSIGSPHLSISNFDTSADFDRLPDALSKRDELTHVRLVFVTSISGISDTARQMPLSQVNIDKPNDLSEAHIPTLTRPQSAGRRVMADGKEIKHPIEGYRSYLPDPDVLKHIGLNLDLSPELLMRHLDERAHLVYRPRTEVPLSWKSCFLETPDRTELRIAVNQANHLSAIFDPSYIPSDDITSNGVKNYKLNTCRNVLILAAEDNCLGIDFNSHAIASDQILRPDDPASHEQRAKQAVYRNFEAELRAFSPAECLQIISDPGKLVWVYARALSLAFSCHLELCHRQWNTQFELLAKTSNELCHATDREIFRLAVREYGLYLRYINSTLDNLKRHRNDTDSSEPEDPCDLSYEDPCVSSLEGLVADFEHFARELELLKKSYEFLLQDSRNPLEALPGYKGTHIDKIMQHDLKTQAPIVSVHPAIPQTGRTGGRDSTLPRSRYDAAQVLPLPRHLQFENCSEKSSSVSDVIVDDKTGSLGTSDTRESLGVKSGGVETAKHQKYPKKAGRERREKWTTSRSQRKEVLRLLSSPVNHEAIHEDIRDKRHPDTGGWLFSTRSYQEWLQGSASVLWCYGTLGAGKTFLTSIIIDDLVNRVEFPRGNSAVAYVYCHQRDGIAQTSENIVAALLKQILAHRKPACDSAIETLHLSRVTEDKSLTLLDMQTSIVSVAQDFEHIYIILDALDDCDEIERKKILSFIKHLSEMQTPGKFKVLVSSRSHPMDIRHAFETALQLEISADQEDMTAVIRGKIELKIAQGVMISPQLADEIVEALLQKAEGMDALHKNDIPKNLKAEYILEMQWIEQMEPTQKQLVLNILSWIAIVTRPLHFFELQLALSIGDGDSEIDADALVDFTTMRNLCGGLVILDETQAIRLVHSSAQKYLESIRLVHSSAQKYLESTRISFENDVYSSEDSDHLQTSQCHLFDYAARNWGHHMKLSSKGRDLAAKAVKLLLSPKIFISMCQVFFPPSGAEITYHGEDYGGQKPLHFASRCGLLEVVQDLPSMNNVIAARQDNLGRTPLMYAAENGHDAVVQHWINYNADINDYDNSNLTALDYAAQKGHTSIVILLLCYGASFLVDDQAVQTTLEYEVRSRKTANAAARLIEHFALKATNIPPYSSNG